MKQIQKKTKTIIMGRERIIKIVIVGLIENDSDDNNDDKIMMMVMIMITK